MRSLLCAVVIALAVAGCARKADTDLAELAAAPQTGAVRPVSRAAATQELSPVVETARGAAALSTSDRLPTGAPRRLAAGQPTGPATAVAARASPPIQRAATPTGNGAFVETDARALFRACLRSQIDRAAWLELRRTYWRSDNGVAVLQRCAKWSGLAWPLQGWGGSSDDQNPDQEDFQ
jgi:hypothetical protein